MPVLTRIEPAQRMRILVGLGVFAGLLVVWRHALSLPPYWDGPIGAFAEAIWLKANHFDYMRLVHKELRCHFGGPAVYIWSIVPTIYALLYKAFRPQTVFVLLHIFNLALGGAIAAMLYGLLTEQLRTSGRLALLVVISLCMQPMYAGQLASITMSIPVAAAVFASGIAMIRGKYRRAGLLALLALFVKDAATLLCLVNLVYGLLLLAAGRERDKWRAILLWTLLPLIVRFTINGYIFSFEKLDGGFNQLNAFANPVYLRAQLVSCVPDFALGTVVVAVAAVVFAIPAFRSIPRTLAALREMLDHMFDTLGPAFVHSVGMVVILLLFYVCAEIPVPRYFVWHAPFLAFSLTAVLRRIKLDERWQARVVLALCALFLLNAGGRFLPPVPEAWRRSGEMLERSSEYMRDLRGQQMAAAYLEKHAGDRPVVTILPMEQMLTLPELGYVTKPLNVYSAWVRPATYCPLKPVSKLPPEQGRNAIVCYIPNCYDGVNNFSLQPRAQDQILFQHTLNGMPLQIYQAGRPETSGYPSEKGNEK